MKSIVIIFTCFLLNIFCFEVLTLTQVEKCDSGIKPNVTIGDCEIPPCELKLGTTAGFQMNFRSPSYLEHAQPKINATVMGLTIDYPLPSENICDGVTNTPCPLAEDEYVEYYFGMSLSYFFPELPLNLVFAIVDNDQNNEVVVCFKFDAQTRR